MASSFPVIAKLCNKILVKLWPFKLFAMTNFILARPCPEKTAEAPLVSVIVAARNEAGNIAEIFRVRRKWVRGRNLSLWRAIPRMIPMPSLKRKLPRIPERKSQLHRQTGKGKAMPCAWDLRRQKAIY